MDSPQILGYFHFTHFLSVTRIDCIGHIDHTDTIHFAYIGHFVDNNTGSAMGSFDNIDYFVDSRVAGSSLVVGNPGGKHCYSIIGYTGLGNILVDSSCYNSTNC